MAISSPLQNRPPEESDNPGDEEFDKLIEHNYSPEEKERLSQIANGGQPESTAGNGASDYPSQENLSNLENSGGQGAVSHTYRPGNRHEHRSFSPVYGFIEGRRRKAIIGGAVLAILISAILLFLSILPFKILHIMNNLQSHFFSTSENALSKETDVLLSDYVKKYVLPGLNTCAAGRTIDKSCTPKAIQGGSIVSNLYRGWRNARVENTLAEKYGIEFAKAGKHYYIKTPQLTGKGAELDSRFVDPNGSETLNDFFNNSNDPQIRKVSRSELRSAVNDALNSETHYTSTWYRFKVGRLLEQKYGIKRCIVACTAQDNFADWKDSKKLAAKAYLIDRVITPRSQALSIVLKCLLAGTSDSGACSVNTDPPSTSCSSDCELNAEPEAKWESDLRAQLATYRETLGTKSAQALIDEVKAIRDNGYTVYLFQKVFGGIESPDGKNVASDITEKSGEDAATQAQFAEKLAELSKNANIISAINTAANLYDSLSKAGPLLHKLTYVTNAGTMVSAFAMYRTYADEIKTGNVDSTIVGSFTDSLNPGQQDPTDTHAQIGGTAGAEQAPLYTSLIDNANNTTSKTVSLVNSLLPAKALADTATYTCNDGNPVPAGKLVCPEENLNNNSIADDFNTAFSTEPLSFIKQVVDKFEATKHGLFGPIFKVVNWTLNQLSGFISKIASLIPGVSDLESLATQLLDKLTGFLISQVIPSPVSSNNSGGRMFDMVAGGADVSGNDVAHHGLGGQQLSQSQQAAILNDQQQLDNAQYHSQSVIARLFDTNSDNSLVTKLAMAMPSSFDNFRLSLAGLFTNPFKNISSIFQPAYAAGSSADPFGITQYGYAENDPIFREDPDQYWSQHCVDPGQEGNPQVSLAANKETYQWNASAALNPVNEMPENSSTNPCLLIESAVGSAGGLFDSSLLTPDDLGSTSSDSTTGPSSPPSGDSQQLAQQILSDKNVQLTGRDVSQDIQDAANGQPGTAGVKTSSAILQLILAVAQKHTVEISAIQSGGTGHCDNTPKSACPNDPHYNGDAVDFSALDGKALQGRDAGSLTIMRIAFPILPGGSGFGQSNCGPTPKLPNGDITFEDTCNHLHVQVPEGTP